MLTTLAKHLRPGDRLEPDGTEVISVTTYSADKLVLVVIKEPRQRRATWRVAADWPFRIQTGEPK